MSPLAKKTFPSIFAIALLSVVGCEAQPNATATLPVNSALSVEERAVLDALDRFIGDKRLSELTIEPNQYFSKAPKDIGGAVVTVMTREQLAQQHAGEKVAPLITTINVNRPTPKPAPGLCVSIIQGAAATTDFEVHPYAMLVTYCYAVKDRSLELISENVEVE